MNIEELDFLQSPRIQSLRKKAEESQKEDDKKRFLLALTREIIKALGNVNVSNLSDGVNVNNLDEIKASLRNELTKANKPITDILNKLNMSTKEQTQFLKELEDKASQETEDSTQTIVVRQKIKDRVEVTNLSDIVFPNEISVNNLEELSGYLQQMIDKISGLKLDVNVEAPNVNVPAPIVNVPETRLNIPEVDFGPIIEELDRQLNKIRTNSVNRPLAVRLTDGQEWIKELRKQTAATTQYLSDISYVKNAAGITINPATEDTLASIASNTTPAGLSGAGVNGTLALASADTWYSVPTTVPTSDYILVVTLENAAGTIRWGFSNATTPSVTNGNIAPNNLSIPLAANAVIYYGSSTAGDDVNWTTKVL